MKMNTLSYTNSTITLPNIGYALFHDLPTSYSITEAMVMPKTSTSISTLKMELSTLRYLIKIVNMKYKSKYHRIA